jgi:hypothetical protein
MITRRRFLIHAATTGISTISYPFFDQALTFFQNHNEPLLIPPKDAKETLYFCLGEWPEFRLGAIDPPIPRYTWREFYERFDGGWQSDYDTESDFFDDYGFSLDSFVPEGAAYETWLAYDAPHIRAYKYLDSLGLREGRQGTKELSDILFVEGDYPSSVTAEDTFCTSLLQHELNRRGTGVKIEIAGDWS